MKILFRFVTAYIAVTLLGCDLLPNETETETRHISYFAASFDTDNSVLFLEDLQKTWGPQSSHNQVSNTKTVFTAATSIQTPVKIMQLNDHKADSIAELYAARLTNNTTFFVTENRLTQEYGLIAYDASGVEITRMLLEEPPINLDTSPDGSLIAVSTANSFKIVNDFGTVVESSDQYGFFVWKTDAEAFLYHPTTDSLVILDLQLSFYTEQGISFKPRQYNSLLDQLYGITDNDLHILDVQPKTTTVDSLDFVPANFEYSGVIQSYSVSTDGDLILLRGALVDQHGFYLLNRTEQTITPYLLNYQETTDI
ncbi:MAG: hypothetical protein OEZ58_12470 [Gammaproteobacteria bacterium]|nr:hypothetical protein [Gammaproteobacteria bacterium]MDH5729800.1 hypothetical protein [Gammaproteobacteria bacterium]